MVNKRGLRSEYGLIGLGGLSYFCYTFVWFLFPAYLITVTESVDFSLTQAGFIAGIIPFVYVIFSIIAGAIIDRIGSQLGIGIGLMIFGSAQIWRGTAETFWAFLLATVFIGVGGTAITFGLPRLVSDLVPSELVGTMSSVYMVGSHLGSAAAFGLVRPYLDPIFGGWRLIFILSGAATIGFAVIWLLVNYMYYRRNRDETVLIPYRSDEGYAEGGSKFSFRSIREEVGAVISHPQMLLLVVVGTMYLFVMHGLRGWLTAILEQWGVAAEFAATMTSALIVAQIAGTLALPAVADYFGKRELMVVVCGVLVTIGTAGLLVGWTDIPKLALVILITGFGLGGLSPLIRAIPLEMDQIGSALPATAISVIFTVGQIGGFLGPFAIGGLRNYSATFGWGLLLLVASSAVIVVAGYRLVESVGT